MADIRPFCALLPPPSLARRVIAPPYDVLTDEEAREIAKERKSFVRVTRSEVDLPAGADSHSQEAYQQAFETLNELIDNGTLIQDDEASFYFYGQKMGNHYQLGLLAAASVDEYNKGTIKKHELTRPDKENDRTQHMATLNAQVGLVFLTYRTTPELDKIFKTIASLKPLWVVTTEDDVEHSFYRAPRSANPQIQAAFSRVPALYIADGHHRSAAASRIDAERKSATSAHFLAGMFPSNALQVMAYNRVVHDLNGHSLSGFLDLVRRSFLVDDIVQPTPNRAGMFTMYIDGKWYSLAAKNGVVDLSDPVSRLDVAVLQDHLLQPILGIDDPRRSNRISFIGGIRGHSALSQAVDKGAAVAFHCYPTPLDQLFEVADAGKVMPPKSTWFEPKLREGVVVRPL